MPEWLQALRRICDNGAPSILITVAEAQGSTPRATGARMVVALDRQYDTIGGGHLEWRAIELAQEILRAADTDYTPQLHRFPLGPALGQCCGGVTQLLFEKLDATPQTQTMIATLTTAWDQNRDIWRVLPLAPGACAALLDGPAAAALTTCAATHMAKNAAGVPCLYDFCRNHRPQVVLFGAGHVGRALATLLGALPCRLIWVDEREDLFPASLPANTRIEVTDDPTRVVAQAAAGSYFIVMTHSHAIDQQLAERILLRHDAAWFGLIGSATKRRLFLNRLSQRGLSAEQLADLTCPIGVAGIDSKEPANIAIAVAAQLLQLWERS